MFTMPVPTAPLSSISQLSVKQIFANAALGGNSSDHEIVKKLSPAVLNAEAVFAHSPTSGIFPSSLGHAIIIVSSVRSRSGDALLAPSWGERNNSIILFCFQKLAI